MSLDRFFGQYLAALAERATRARWPSRVKYLHTFALLACLLGASVLAHASPPDPMWLPGIYDGADLDDEPPLITDPPVAGDSRPPVAGLVYVALGLTLAGSASLPSDRSLLGSHLRSPPIS